LALTRGPIVECVQTGTVRQWDEQDGFAFRAEQVRMSGVEPGSRAAPARPSGGAYRSTLTIRYDDGRTETWPG
jgi:hypothetical protein